MTRYALCVEYDGSGFNGWQRLSKLGNPDADVPRSVQASLETALAKVADAPIDTVCAGRTDTGVHGLAQVVHFDSDAQRDPRAWTLGVTGNLPPQVSALWCQPVSNEFNARFSAVARRYRYRIVNRISRPGYQRRFLSWERRPLDAQVMHEAAQVLIGERDFSAFRSSQCQATHARRNLQFLRVSRQHQQVIVDVQANAFLHHMVRNLVGSLMMVGAGERDARWLEQVLESQDRNLAGPTAPPNGLSFIGPLYPAHWNLPADVTWNDDIEKGFAFA